MAPLFVAKSILHMCALSMPCECDPGHGTARHGTARQGRTVCPANCRPAVEHTSKGKTRRPKQPRGGAFTVLLLLCRRSSCVGSSYRCAKARCRWCARQLSRTLHPSHSRWRRCTSKPNFCLSLQSLQPTMQSPVRPPLAFPQPPPSSIRGGGWRASFFGEPPSLVLEHAWQTLSHTLSK